MKKSTKKLFGFAGLAFATILLSSCTKSFCSVQDKANNLARYEVANIESINETAQNNGLIVPQVLFLHYIDLQVEAYADSTDETIQNSFANSDEDYKKNVSRYAGLNEKGNHELWYNYDAWYREFYNLPTPTADQYNSETTDVSTLKLEDITFGGPLYAPSESYVTYYKQQLNSRLSGNVACLTPESGEYGTGDNKVYIEGKSWKQAFEDYGPIEGLLVYPVGCMLHYFTKAFGTDGWGQVVSIMLVTFIVRLLIVAVTFPSTMSQSRMSELAPQLQEIQAKYPNADKNPTEKQQLAAAQMALYKKNKVHPFLQILVMIVQFPIFIAVWGAMQGSAILTQGSLFGLQLTTTTFNAIRAFNVETPFAIVLILMMSIAQFISTKLPQWFQAWKTETFAETTVKNEAATKQNKTAKYMSTFMLVFIIFMGFTLPAAMGIYWFFGAIISIIQTLVMEVYQRHSRHKRLKGGPKKGRKVKSTIVRRGKKL